MKETKKMIQKMVVNILKNPQAYMDKDVLTDQLEMIAKKARKELIKEQIAYAEKSINP